MKILVINSGSSSVKMKVFTGDDLSQVASGTVERIGEQQSTGRYQWLDGAGEHKVHTQSKAFKTHKEGFAWLFGELRDMAVIVSPDDLHAIGHRVVHGGERFVEAVLVNDEVLAQIKELISLAPLHIPSNVLGIEVAREFFRGVQQVAVFDTSFHQSMPHHAYVYALPYSLYTTHGVRRYGFHGISHAYVARKAAAFLGQPLRALNMITLHLGNGASAAAIRAGQCIDTSMGMTPLEGLMMGTRCGNIDPSLPFHLQRVMGVSSNMVEHVLNNESGLFGICGTNDMREVEKRASGGDELAGLAIKMFCYAIKKYIGAYHAVLGELDAMVFTGGIGENSSLIRERSCEGLQCIGIDLDVDKNAGTVNDILEIQGSDSCPVLVIRTNEEEEIARQIAESFGASRP